MKILVASCDKEQDTFSIFHHCIEEYWPDHPEVIYSTETIINPYYKTICKNYPLNLWTKRIRETLQELESDTVLLVMSDCFIRKEVDTKRLYELESKFGPNTAMFNLEKSFDKNDLNTDIDGMKLRQKHSSYEVSIMCGLWNRLKLINVLGRDSDPWDVELNQDSKGYDYYINAGDFIIDWGYNYLQAPALKQGKWMHEVVDFLNKEGIEVDYSKRGFYD